MIDQQTPGQLLDPQGAVSYLADHGLIDARTASATPLGGGVSNIVIAVQDDKTAVVVKQSLSRLRVADEWLAPQGRALTEAVALTLAAGLVPGSAPEVVHRDRKRHVIVLERAPLEWADWKQRLLSGDVDPRPAARVGELLGAWHTATAGGAGLPREILDAGTFEALRVEPYYRATAARAPEVADRLLSFADEMTRRRTCLVHGDLSPKNVLVGEWATEPPVPLWVIDFEVAHYGDPAFDLAFLLTHLCLKAVHRPESTSGYDACARAFAQAYLRQIPERLRPDWRYVLGHVGCLLLARVRGKSPAEYLTESQRAAAWRLGRAILAQGPGELSEVHRLRDELRG